MLPKIQLNIEVTKSNAFLPALSQCNNKKNEDPIFSISFTKSQKIDSLFNSFKRQFHEMVKHTQTIRRQQTSNCFIVFDHFVGLALEGLRKTLQ